MALLRSSSADDPRSRPRVDLELVIPAYNEASRISWTLQRTVEYLDKQDWTSRVLVVDNGSVDGTGETVLRWIRESATRVPVEVVGCSRPGKGAAVRRGLMGSRSRFVGFFDADLATPLEVLEPARQYLLGGACAVIGSRHAPGARFVRPQPLGRRAGGAAFRMMSRRLVDGILDTQCGFKFFERDAAVRALVRCRMSGFAFDVELLRRLQEQNGRIVEIPVDWTDGADSSFRPLSDGLASFGAIMGMQNMSRT